MDLDKLLHVSVSPLKQGREGLCVGSRVAALALGTARQTHSTSLYPTFESSSESSWTSAGVCGTDRLFPPTL